MGRMVMLLGEIPWFDWLRAWSRLWKLPKCVLTNTSAWKKPPIQNNMSRVRVKVDEQLLIG